MQLVKLLVVATFLLCMSAPEELFYTHVESDLNPFVGATKLSLLGLALAILLLCRQGRRHWAIAGPFGMFMAWSVFCWIVAGANILPARNLVSSFGGIVVLAAFCAAADVLGGIRILVRLLIYGLIVGGLVAVPVIRLLSPMHRLQVATLVLVAAWLAGFGWLDEQLSARLDPAGTWEWDESVVDFVRWLGWIPLVVAVQRWVNVRATRVADRAPSRYRRAPASRRSGR